MPKAEPCSLSDIKIFPRNSEADDLAMECDSLRDVIDDMVNEIGSVIDDIAETNGSYACEECIKTAKRLWQIMYEQAREEDAQGVLERFAYKTGISLNDD